MSHSYDLAIIGGGPAGAAAAITAARSGASVLLLERGRYPRHKVCGEFVSAEAIGLLKWLLGEFADDLFRAPIALTESRLFLDGRTIHVPIRPAAVSIARYDLDLALWKAACREGAAAYQETAVQRVEGGNPFRIQTSAGEFRARAVINASGRWSNLNWSNLKRSNLNWPNSNRSHAKPVPPHRNGGPRWLGLKAHFYGEMEPVVDLYFFEGGYCGVQPVRNGASTVNVCALFQPAAPERKLSRSSPSRPDASASFDDLFARHPVLRERARHWKLAFPALSTFPVTFRNPRPVSGTIFNAGDAAAFVDPFVGDGISLALRGGNLAARNAGRFLAGQCDLEEAIAAYAQDYRRSLRPVYQASSLLRKFLLVPRRLRAPFLMACERSPRLARYLVKTTRSRTVPQDF